jgi:hypothetical protein
LILKLKELPSFVCARLVNRAALLMHIVVSVEHTNMHSRSDPGITSAAYVFLCVMFLIVQ